MTWTDRLVAGAFTLALATLGGPASAQTEATAARALFNEARALAEKGEHAAACPKFEESMRLRPGEGTRFNLADCWEQIGRTASAWGEFLEVASSSKRSGRKEREKLARRRAEALEPKLSRLVIQVAARESGLNVMRDGVEVRDGTWGTAVPVDPGRHSISARAPGKRPWFREIEVSGTEPVIVDIPRLDREKSAESGDKSQTSRANNERANTDAKSEPKNDAQGNELRTEGEPATLSSSGRETRRALAYVAGGATVAMVVLGTVFYLDFKSKNDEAASMCRALSCDRRGVERHNDLVDRAEASRTLSYLSFGAGTLALGGAAVLYLTSEPSQVESGGALELRPLIGSGLTGLSASGSF